MTVWSVYGDDGVVPAKLIPMFIICGWIVMMLVQSAILVQYARGRRNAPV